MSGKLIVATRKGLFLLERNKPGAKTKWRIADTAFLGDHVVQAIRDPRDGAMYAALKHGHFGGKLHRSDDDGDTWIEVGVPQYPEPPGGKSPDVCPMTNKEIPWKLELIWSIAPGGSDQPNLLWCGTIPGGLFKSTDRGMNWTLVRSLWNEPARKQWFGGGYDLPGIHSILVDPRDTRSILLGVSCGGAWRTTDGGESWKCSANGMFAAYMPPEQAYDPNIQDPHIIAACRDVPDALWTQHHNGVFRSVNGGAAWTQIKQPGVSGFGFACAVHPTKPDTAWFVPGLKDERRIPVDGRLVVTRTCDGGESFDVLSNGLPGEHAYDIAYRHALDIDDTGRCLAFGTTTGSLFASDDEGDHWECQSHHLPPIHAVRFA